MTNSGYQCTLFSPGDVRGIPAQVSLKSIGLAVEWEDGRFEIAYHALSASKGGYNNRMLVLSGKNDTGNFSLYFNDKSIAQGLSGYRLPPGLATQIARAVPRGGTARKALLWTALIAGIGFVLYLGVVSGFDALVDFGVEQVPVELETELGKSAAKEQLGNYEVCSAQPVNDAITEIGERLVKGLDKTPYTFRFKVIDTPDLNAFALPAGYIFINWGLIEAAQTPDEVAGVVAHEIQHAVKRHGLRNVIARAGIGLLAMLVIGDVQGLGGIIAGGATLMAELSFSREQEEEADRLGIELLYAAQFDPNGMPRFFEKLKEKEHEMGLELPAFLSTHPDTDARIAGLQQMIQAQGQATITPITIKWDTVKEAGCIPTNHSDPDKEVKNIEGTSDDNPTPDANPPVSTPDEGGMTGETKELNVHQ